MERLGRLWHSLGIKIYLAGFSNKKITEKGELTLLSDILLFVVGQNSCFVLRFYHVEPSTVVVAIGCQATEPFSVQYSPRRIGLSLSLYSDIHSEDSTTWTFHECALN